MGTNNKCILILVNHEVVIYNFRLELVERLLDEGYDVHISCPYGERIEELKGMGAVCYDVQLDRHGVNPLAEMGLIYYYHKLMKSVKPQIVFSYTIKPNIYGAIAASMNHVPIVANITGLGTAVEGGGIKQKAILSLYKVSLRNAQKIFFQNKSNCEFMVKRGVIKTPYEVLPGSGVNLERNVLEEYPKESGRLIFTTIGRIMKDKGTDELIEAAKTVRSKYPNVEFRMIGFFDDDYQAIIKAAVEQGVIKYISQQKNIHPFIKESHLIIHPSHHEGMSNVLLEAAATGRPIIASDIPGCREAFYEGQSGFGFKVGDSDDLAKVIERFISLPHEKKAVMGLNGRKLMEEHFNREIVVDIYMSEVLASAK